MSRSTLRRAVAAVVAVAAAVTLVGCATGGGATSPIRVGWVGGIPPLDPAASDSVGSFALLSQLYPSLLTVDAGSPEPVPEIAESAGWTAEGVYTIVLKRGLEFANGDALTSSDVKFSIERQLALQSEDGSWRQFANLDTVETVDDTTVEFHLGTPVDTRFPFVLAGPAGLVLDEEVFFADELTPDDDIVEGEPFAGAYTLTATRGDALVLRPYAGFGGARKAFSALEVHPGEAEDIAQRVAEGTLDVMSGRLTAEAVATLRGNDDVERVRAASGRARLLAFDFLHMPFGTRTETPDAALALAVRTAAAHLVDRDAIVDEIGANWLRPLTGYLPDGIPGEANVTASVFGDGEGGPSAEAATAVLTAAGIAAPVPLRIHVALDQVGEPGAEEVAELARQLETDGLFEVDVVETDTDGLGVALLAGDVQAYFTSVLPANVDPQQYLAPYRSTNAAVPGFANADIDALLARLMTEVDPEVREATLVETQRAIAGQLPAIPITQGVRVVYTRSTLSTVKLADSLALDLSRLRR